MIMLTKITALMLAMTASVFATPTAFGQISSTGVAVIDDSDQNTQVNSAEVNPMQKMEQKSNVNLRRNVK
jgi:multimeric flavodoxin WrbA